MQGTHDFFLFNPSYTISSKINATIQYTSPCQDPFNSSRGHSVLNSSISSLDDILFVSLHLVTSFGCNFLFAYKYLYYFPIIFY